MRLAPTACARPLPRTGAGRHLGPGRQPTTVHGRSGVHDRPPRHPGSAGPDHPPAALPRATCARLRHPPCGARRPRSWTRDRRYRPSHTTAPRERTGPRLSDPLAGHRRGARDARTCRDGPGRACPPQAHCHRVACRPMSRCVVCRRPADRAMGAPTARRRAPCRDRGSGRGDRVAPYRLYRPIPGWSAHHHGSAEARRPAASRRRTSRCRHGRRRNRLRDHRDRARHDSRVADDRGQNHPRCSPDERTSAAALPIARRERSAGKCGAE
jgi:hypothetical protein